jgi:hypothetical protein
VEDLASYQYAVAVPTCFVWKEWLSLASTTPPAGLPFAAWTEQLRAGGDRGAAAGAAAAGLSPPSTRSRAVAAVRAALDPMVVTTVAILRAATSPLLQDSAADRRG